MGIRQTWRGTTTLTLGRDSRRVRQCPDSSAGRRWIGSDDIAVGEQHDRRTITGIVGLSSPPWRASKSSSERLALRRRVARVRRAAPGVDISIAGARPMASAHAVEPKERLPSRQCAQ